MGELKLNNRQISILLVEDNPGDVLLTREALSEIMTQDSLNVARDGKEALDYLDKAYNDSKKQLPDMILLDLNLPKINGHEVLQKIKSDTRFLRIPVIVLSTSAQEQDILKSYNTHANAYLTKPIEMDNFINVIKSLNEFWFGHVTLPPE